MLLEIALVNASKIFPNAAQWIPVLKALQLQLTRDVGPTMGVIPPPVVFYTRGQPTPLSAALVTITDTPDEPDALGYHDEHGNGSIYGRVFVQPTMDNGGSLCTGVNSVSCTLSHEIIEIVGNSCCQMWADNALDGLQYCVERCDPVEMDAGYQINTIGLSNFVTDRWFDAKAPPSSKFDFLGHLKNPFSMTPGGYMIRRRPGGQEEQIFGKDYPAWKAALKLKHGRLSRLLSKQAQK